MYLLKQPHPPTNYFLLLRDKIKANLILCSVAITKNTIGFEQINEVIYYCCSRQYNLNYQRIVDMGNRR